MTHIFEWIKAPGTDGTYGIYLNRGGVKYPLAIIELSPALGSNDLESLLRAAHDLLAAHKRIAQKAGALADDHHTWVYNTDEGQEIMRLVREIGAEAEAAIARATPGPAAMKQRRIESEALMFAGVAVAAKMKTFNAAQRIDNLAFPPDDENFEDWDDALVDLNCALMDYSAALCPLRWTR